MTTPTPEQVEAVAKATHDCPVSWMPTTWEKADGHVRQALFVCALAAIAAYERLRAGGEKE